MALAGRKKSELIPEPVQTSEPTPEVQNEDDNLPDLKNNEPFEVIPVNEQDNLEGIIEREPVLAPRPERETVVDSQYVPSSHLMIHAEGSDWHVDYFRQVLANATELRPLQVGTSSPAQQYERVNGYVLKVTTPLSQSQDLETKNFEVTGGAGMFFGLVPNFGDMFIADVGDGRSGLFTVTRSQRMAYTKEAAYEVEYRMIDYVDDSYKEELKRKTIKEFMFDLRMLELHENPFMTRADYTTLNTLDDLDEFIREHFIRMFWSKEVSGYRLPNQKEIYRTYDAWHSEFCFKIALFTHTNHVRRYHLGNLNVEDTLTLWDVIDDMNLYNIRHVHKEFGIADSHYFRHKAVMRGIGWSPYNWTVYPKGELNIPDDLYPNPPLNPITDKEREEVPTPVMLPEALSATLTIDNPMFYHVDKDEFYVLSKAFYEQDLANCSVLEYCLLKMLAGETIEGEVTAALANQIVYEGKLEQFYYIPLVLQLMYYSKRSRNV